MKDYLLNMPNTELEYFPVQKESEQHLRDMTEQVTLRKESFVDFSLHEYDQNNFITEKNVS